MWLRGHSSLTLHLGGGGVSLPRKKRYERVRCNVISVTRGWVGVKFPEKQHYVTLEWPLTLTIEESQNKDGNKTSQIY